MKFKFFILFLIIFSFGSCDKGQTIEDSIPASDLSNSFSSGCLPSNINLLYSIDGSDTIKIYRTGFWHNKLLDKYEKQGVFPSYSCGYNYMNSVDSMIRAVATVYFSTDDVGDYIDLISDFDSLYNPLLNIACEDSSIIFAENLIDDLILQYDTLSLLNSAEKAIIIEALNYSKTGFGSLADKEDLIDDWTNTSGKFMDGIISGGIIAILIYSDCYWQNFDENSYTEPTANLRWLPLVLGDVAGAGLSFINSAVRGEQSGANSDPGAGLAHLKKAGMDGLRTSAGPLGVLF